MTDYKLICECGCDRFDRINGKIVCRKCGVEYAKHKTT